MKRIKYTNTGITPLSVIRTSDKGHYIFDDTKNGTLSIYVVRLRNHSKNESAKCRVIFDNKEYCFNVSKDFMLTEISNIYLFWMVKYKNHQLFLKMFGDCSFHSYMDGYRNFYNFMLFGYVGKCVIHKLVKDGVI